MSNYITNRESLKRHCEATCKKFKDIPTSGLYGEHRLVLDLLEQTEWIPVSERLPEPEIEVLVTDDAGGLATISTDSIYESEETGEKEWYSSQRVTAWMPLPEPYKAESEN